MMAEEFRYALAVACRILAMAGLVIPSGSGQTGKTMRIKAGFTPKMRLQKKQGKGSTSLALAKNAN